MYADFLCREVATDSLEMLEDMPSVCVAPLFEDHLKVCQRIGEDGCFVVKAPRCEILQVSIHNNDKRLYAADFLLGMYLLLYFV